MKKAIITLFFILILSSHAAFGQGIKINEISSSNTNVIQDLDGDYPDWIELFNNSLSTVNLSDYYITDDLDSLAKWQFPNVEVEPDSLLLIFASGKDRRKTIQHWETIIREGDNCIFLVPFGTPTDKWRLTNYNDANWQTGPTGIGYGDNDDNTTISQTITAYIRIKFTVEDINQVSGLFFNVDFDDGFVAYLNGEEIARENLGSVGSPVSYNTLATADHEAQLYQGNEPNGYAISNKINFLQNGENLLAIEVHNSSITSSDLTLIPFLSIGYTFTPSISRGSVDFLNLKETHLHTNFKLSSEGEPLILINSNQEIEDSIFTRKQLSDISLGRFPNGSENFFFFDSPTPEKKNLDNGFVDFLESPVFSVERGFYPNAFFLDISNPNSSGVMHYTTDGSEPNKSSTVYSNQLVVSRNSVIRAKIFNDGFLPSMTETHSYFVNEVQSLPIISISTNPEHFFDYDSGIYVLGPNAEAAFPHFGANFWQDWERPIHVEFFEENNEFGFEIDLGVKIFGQWSRGNPQKSLALYSRKEYGYSEIDYKLFQNSEIDKYQSIVLRNSGNDWNNTMIRDPLFGEIAAPLDIDRQMYRPVVVYLNGEYWGLHNLREKVNEHFIESHHNIDSDDLNIIENNFQLVEGEIESYEEFYYSLNDLDMSLESAFEYIDSNIDINEFIDYYLIEIYIDNQDWPGNNIKFWQQRSTNSKWRWILYDTDFGFGIWNSLAYKNNTLDFALEENGPTWPNPPWSTFLLRKFMENEKFKNLFISRYSTYSNTIFLSNNITQIISDFSGKIDPELPTHFQRWGGSYSSWLSRINSLKVFAANRVSYLTAYFASGFGISGLYKLSIDQNIEHGTVAITDFTIEEETWEGSFFNNIPLNIEAKPKEGFTFSNWEGDLNSTENPLTILVSENFDLTPVYVVSNRTSQIVINEINYNSSDTFNPEDWVELYNPSPQSIDLSGWIFKDSDSSHSYIIPENTLLDPDSYIVLCKDSTLFKSYFPNVENFVGDLNFGLSGAGELIRLYNNFGTIIDSLTYDDSSPWPTECDGNGPTLELKNHTRNNSHYSSWDASSGNGTPGGVNSVFTSISEKSNIQPSNFRLYQNYPNPFNPSTNITFEIPARNHVTISVYNLLGERVAILANGVYAAGSFTVKFDGARLSSGLYLIRMQSENFIGTNKALLIK